MRYRLFGRSGLRVSEICLGTMSFGEEGGFGANEPTSHEVLDAYADRGGNFLDTANKYHNGQTEEYVGRWLENKRDYYLSIADEDLPRIRMIEERNAIASGRRLSSVAA